MSTPIRIEFAPADGEACRFTVNRPVHEMGDGTYRFTSTGDARGVPVAEAVISVPGIREVVLGDGWVEVWKVPQVDWCDLEEPVQYAIMAAVERLEETDAPEAAGALDDDTMFSLVSEIFDRDINPAVARHGGAVELIDVQDATVVLRMMGGCQGCGMANVTLRQGIEATLRRALPNLAGIQDITDHQSGANPYFAQQK